MKIETPYVEYWPQTDTNAHIARCARVCYASDKTTGNDKMCKALWKNNHRSMFRHASVYYIIPEKIQINPKAYIGSQVVLVRTNYYVSTNEQCAREFWDYKYKKYRISCESARSNVTFHNLKLLRYTFCIYTGIDITREYNRKSPNNIAEQSTRYVDFIKKVGIKFKRCHWMTKCNWYRTILYKFMLKTTEWFYKIARSKYGLNLQPQDARFILPLDTMSVAVYTYTVAEWELILNMREFDYTGKAHKDAKVIAEQIHTLFDNLGVYIENWTTKNEY